jgi:hypothetical protein
MGMLPAIFVELKASSGEFKTVMAEAKAEITNLEKHGEVSMAKLGKVAKAALLGIGAVAVGVGVVAVEMADKFEKSHAKLEVALKNGGKSYEEYKTQIEAASEAQSKFGFNSAQTEDALAILTTQLKSPEKALKALSVATDLAKYKNLDLSEAALMVGKAANGQIRPIRALGLDLPVAAGGAMKLKTAQDKLKTAQEAYNALLAKSHDTHVRHVGSTEAVSKAQQTYNEKLAIYNSHTKHTLAQQYSLQHAADKVKESQGKLNEVVVTGGVSSDALAKAQAKVEEAQKKVNDVAHAGTDIMAGLASAVKGQAAKQAETFGGKMDALKAKLENAFVTIGLALMPTLVKLADLIEKDVVPQVTAFADGLAGITKPGDDAANSAKNVGTAIRDVAKIVKDNFSTFKNFAELLAILWATDKAFTAAAAFSTVFSAIRTAMLPTIAVAATTAEAEAAATGGASVIAAAPFITALGLFFGGKIWGMAKGASASEVQANKQRGGFRGGGTGTGNNLYQAGPSAITNIVKKHAMGGIFTQPTIGMIGEVGPEAVIPLSKVNSFGGGMIVNIHVAGSVVQERDLAVSVRDHIAQMMRRTGNNPSILGV